MRCSPLGEPMLPHIARSIESPDGGKAPTFSSRKDHTSSDGHPFAPARGRSTRTFAG